MKTHIVTSVLLNNKIEEDYNKYRELKAKELIDSKEIDWENSKDCEVLEKVIKIDSFISVYDLIIEKQKFLASRPYDPKLERTFNYITGLKDALVRNRN